MVREAQSLKARCEQSYAFWRLWGRNFPGFFQISGSFHTPLYTAVCLSASSCHRLCIFVISLDLCLIRIPWWYLVIRYWVSEVALSSQGPQLVTAAKTFVSKRIMFINSRAGLWFVWVLPKDHVLNFLSLWWCYWEMVDSLGGEALGQGESRGNITFREVVGCWSLLILSFVSYSKLEKFDLHVLLVIVVWHPKKFKAMGIGTFKTAK